MNSELTGRDAGSAASEKGGVAHIAGEGLATTARQGTYRWWLGAATSLLIAVILRLWAAPAFERLPSDYTAETSYVAQMRSRQTPSSPAEEFETVVRRQDQTLTFGAGHSVIQGQARWYTPTGRIVFEVIHPYGVDRRTRENLPGYGDQDRAGQYLFPPHVGKKKYDFWDPIYAGPGVVMFDRVESFRGVEVYVFSFVAEGIDETPGYSALPDVPEKYRALTSGKGRYWVEPVSGVVVDHEDSGVSYFIDTAKGERIGEPMNQWDQRYTPETITAQLQIAVATRWKMRALQTWLPLAFAAMGLIGIAAGFRTRCGGAR